MCCASYWSHSSITFKLSTHYQGCSSSVENFRCVAMPTSREQRRAYLREKRIERRLSQPSQGLIIDGSLQSCYNDFNSYPPSQAHNISLIISLSFSLFGSLCQSVCGLLKNFGSFCWPCALVHTCTVHMHGTHALYTCTVHMRSTHALYTCAVLRSCEFHFFYFRWVPFIMHLCFQIYTRMKSHGRPHHARHDSAERRGRLQQVAYKVHSIHHPHQRTQYTPNHTPHTINHTLYPKHTTPYTMHTTPYTTPDTPYASHAIQQST